MSDEPERVITGSIHDLPNPLARAYGMAMTIGLVVDLINPEGVEDFLAAWTLDVDERGIRDLMLLRTDAPDDLKAEAIFFMASLVACNRNGENLSEVVHEMDGRPFVAITPERYDPDGPGVGKLAVEMCRSAGIENPRAFKYAPPPEPEPGPGEAVAA